VEFPIGEEEMIDGLCGASTQHLSTWGMEGSVGKFTLPITLIIISR
jgi:hypothetical protein